MSSQRKQKINLIFLLMIIIAIIGGIVIFSARVDDKIREYIKVRSELANFQEKITSFSTEEKQFNAKKTTFFQIENAFFEIDKETLKSEKIGDFENSIESMAKKNNISVEPENITEPTIESNFYLLEFKVRGKFLNILRFFFAVEDTPLESYQLMEINKINLSRLISASCPEGEKAVDCDEEETKSEVEGTFELKLYTKPKEKKSDTEDNQSFQPAEQSID